MAPDAKPVTGPSGTPALGGEVAGVHVGIRVGPEAEDVDAEEAGLLAQAHEKVPFGPQPLERPSFRQNETVRIASYTPVMIPTGPNRVANVSNAAVPTIRPAISLTQKPFVQTLLFIIHGKSDRDFSPALRRRDPQVRATSKV